MYKTYDYKGFQITASLDSTFRISYFRAVITKYPPGTGHYVSGALHEYIGISISMKDALMAVKEVIDLILTIERDSKLDNDCPEGFKLVEE